MNEHCSKVAKEVEKLSNVRRLFSSHLCDTSVGYNATETYIEI